MTEQVKYIHKKENIEEINTDINGRDNITVTENEKSYNNKIKEKNEKKSYKLSQGKQEKEKEKEKKKIEHNKSEFLDEKKIEEYDDNIDNHLDNDLENLSGFILSEKSGLIDKPKNNMIKSNNFINNQID